MLKSVRYRLPDSVTLYIVATDAYKLSGEYHDRAMQMFVGAQGAAALTFARGIGDNATEYREALAVIAKMERRGDTFREWAKVNSEIAFAAGVSFLLARN